MDFAGPLEISARFLTAASLCACTGYRPHHDVLVPSPVVAGAKGAEVITTNRRPAKGETTSGDMPDYVRRPGPLTMSSGIVLPGPCVDPLLHAAFALNSGATLETYQSQYYLQAPWIDLDGDGLNDFVVRGGGVPEGAYYLYLRRGDCGYHVGTIPRAESFGSSGEMRGGLLQLFSVSHGCADGGIQRRQYFCRARWAFDGTAYALSLERLIKKQDPSIQEDVPIDDW